MRVAIKEPGKKPEYKDIPNTLEALQEAVGGYIETVTIATDPLMIAIVDEEGLLKGKRRNVWDLVGTIVFCGGADAEFTDVPITPDLVELFMREGGAAAADE